MHLSWIDLSIVALYVGGTIIAGFLARHAIRGISDFLVAGRALRTHMATASMVSTGLGLVTVMYFAEEGFKNGFAPFIIGVIAALSQLIIRIENRGGEGLATAGFPQKGHSNRSATAIPASCRSIRIRIDPISSVSALHNSISAVM